MVSSSHQQEGTSFCGSNAASVGRSLCGPFYILSISFAMTIVVLIAVEYFLHFVEKSARNTPYESVVTKVYKEMTVVGCLTFATLIINIATNGDIPASWHDSIDHADFVMFVITVLYVAQVTLHMVGLVHVQSKRWKLASEVLVDNLLMKFHEEEHEGLYRWLPISSLRDQVEYKIFFALFCHKFNIRKAEFNFSSYLIESFKRYIIGLMEETFIVRMLLGVFIAVNVIRVKLVRNSASGESSHRSSACDGACEAERDLSFFAGCGWCLVVAAIILAFISRLYQIRLLSCGGVNCVDDYRIFLLNEENMDIEKATRARMNGGLRKRASLTMGKADLKTTLESIRKNELEEELEKPESLRWSIRRKRFMAGLRRTVLAVKRCLHLTKAEDLDDDEEEEDEENSRNGGSGRDMVAIDEFSNVEELELENGEGDTTMRSNSRRITSARPILSHVDETAGMSKLRNPKHQMSFNTMMNLQGAVRRHKRVASECGLNVMMDKRSKLALIELDSIFLLHRPKIYFIMIQFVMFLFSVYCAFWITNFGLLPAHSRHKLVWHAVIAGPLVVMTPLLAYIVRISVYIKALSKLRQDVVGKVIEDDDSSERACSYLREKLILRLNAVSAEDNISAHKVLMVRLVAECDKKNKGYITREGFRYMLRKLNLHFTDSRFQEVMDVIDRDKNGHLTPEEFFAFVFPVEAKEEELKQRMEAVSAIATRQPRRESSGGFQFVQQRVGSAFGMLASSSLPLSRRLAFKHKSESPLSSSVEGSDSAVAHSEKLPRPRNVVLLNMFRDSQVAASLGEPISDLVRRSGDCGEQHQQAMLPNCSGFEELTVPLSDANQTAPMQTQYEFDHKECEIIPLPFSRNCKDHLNYHSKDLMLQDQRHNSDEASSSDSNDDIDNGISGTLCRSNENSLSTELLPPGELVSSPTSFRLTHELTTERSIGVPPRLELDSMTPTIVFNNHLDVLAFVPDDGSATA